MSDLPDSGAWRRTSPFAIVFFVVSTAKGIFDGYGRLAASFGITAVLLRYRRYLPMGIALGMLTLIGVAVLRWWFFRYRIAEDRILIRGGIVKRTALDIPFDRVQGINVNRRLIERVAGLVTVVIDTPGTLAAEGHLPAVEPELADQLLRRVEAHRGLGVAGAAATESEEHTFRDEPSAAPGEPGDGSGQPGRAERDVHVLQKLSVPDLVRMGLARPPALLLAVFPIALGVRLDDWVKTLLGVFNTATTTVGGSGILAPALAAVGLGLALLIVGLVAGIGYKIVQNHGFTAWRDGTAFRSRAGLFTQRHVAVQIRKMQQLRLDQGLVFRWFRRYRLACPTVGGSLDQDGDETSGPAAEGLDIPFADGGVVEDLRSQVFSREGRNLSLLPEAGTFTRVSPYYMRARALRVCFVTLPAGVWILFILLYTWVYIKTDIEDSWETFDPAQVLIDWGAVAAIWCIACILLAVPIAWQRWRRRGYMVDKDGLASRGGLIGYEVEASLFRKAQEVTVKQSPMQRRHGLATLDVGTACGSISIPYIDHDMACGLRDYILYKAESSHRPWH